MNSDHLSRQAYKKARRVVVAVLGGTLLLVGAAMIILPGPAMVVIPMGLGILALEFAWARRWLRKVKEEADKAVELGKSLKNSAKNESG